MVNESNVPLEGTYNLTFRLYAAASGGTAIWTETQPAIPISRGVFNVLLGQVTTLDLTFDKDYWLSTQVGTDAEMSPRQRLTSVPYAYRAEMADQVQDQPPGFEVDTGGTLTDGLMAYWKLNEASGARDDQKGPYDLTDHNTVTQSAGKVGTAAKFTAANSEYLSIADNADLSTGNIDFAIVLWIYADTLHDGTPFSKVEAAAAGEREYQLSMDSGGTLTFLIWPAAGGLSAVSSATGAIATGGWHFVVCWHDASANTINIQVNSGTVNSAAANANGPADSTASFRLGAERTTAINPWNGRIDEVGFWKRILSAQERGDLYNNGAGNTYVLGKAANPWTTADAGITYLDGHLGVGTSSTPNILSVQQGSPTDPIADSWTVYPSDRQHKHILRTINPHGYLEQVRAVALYEWTRTPTVSDDEAKQALRKRWPNAEEVYLKKRDLAERKARLPKFTAKRVGVAIDDANVPPEILTFNPDGSKGGIDLLAYIGYLHAALKEAVLKIDELESSLPPPPRRNQ